MIRNGYGIAIPAEQTLNQEKLKALKHIMKKYEAAGVHPEWPDAIVIFRTKAERDKAVKPMSEIFSNTRVIVEPCSWNEY